MYHIYRIAIITVIIFFHTAGFSQSLLSKQVSLQVSRKPLGEVLKTISRQGNFYFSYNSNIINEDSLISLDIKKKSVKQVLEILFDNSYEYKETNTYIIIQYAGGSFWYASGYVKDELTGDHIAYATVYDKKQFISTMTNESGYFRLKMKDRNVPAVLSVSKSRYYDTSIIIKASYNPEVTVSITPQPIQLDSFVVRQNVERNWLGRLFLSSKQRMQGINLGKYFADKPYQTSIIPGLGTHGKMSGQAINKFSFNLLGGYSGGVNGFEMAGAFNINKMNMRGVQLGGIFNMAGGKVDGLQIAGVYNHVLKASAGWQFAGISNFVNNDLSGLQAAGVYNHVWGKTEGVQIGGVANLAKGDVEGVQISGDFNYTGMDLRGVQISGGANFVKDSTDGTQIAAAANYANNDMDGVQVAGFTNIASKTITGTQVAGFVNYAKHVKGVQVSMINIADTSSGVSIGLFNIVFKGYHKFTVSSNEVTDLNFTAKTGNRNLYTILSLGANVFGKEAYTFSYGWGAELKLSKHMFINPEITAGQLYLGDWDFVNSYGRLNVELNYKLHKYLSVFAGPSYTFAYIDQPSFPSGYRQDMPYTGLVHTNHGKYTNSWLGWSFGVNVF